MGCMADNLELDVETLGETLRETAAGLRRLASEILDGEFRRRLLNLSCDYDAQATALEKR